MTWKPPKTWNCSRCGAAQECVRQLTGFRLCPSCRGHQLKQARAHERSVLLYAQLGLPVPKATEVDPADDEAWERADARWRARLIVSARCNGGAWHHAVEKATNTALCGHKPRQEATRMCQRGGWLFPGREGTEQLVGCPHCLKVLAAQNLLRAKLEAKLGRR